jgi:hypothetical protein
VASRQESRDRPRDMAMLWRGTVTPERPELADVELGYHSMDGSPPPAQMEGHSCQPLCQLSPRSINVRYRSVSTLAPAGLRRTSISPFACERA